MDTLKVLTFNVRNCQAHDPSPNSWEERLPRIREFLGGVSDFLAKRRLESLQELERVSRDRVPSGDIAPRGCNGRDPSEMGGVRLAGRSEEGTTAPALSFQVMKAKSKEEKKRRNRVDFLEKEIEKLEARMKAIEAVLSAPKEDDDIMELTREYLECKRELDAKTEEWGELLD